RWGAEETGFLETPPDSLPDPSARLFANVLATGRGGGHDLHLRTLHARGVVLAGHFLGAANGRLQLADDLAERVAWGDEPYLQFRELARTLVARRGLDDEGLDDPEPFAATGPESLDADEFGAVIFTCGFRPD